MKPTARLCLNCGKSLKGRIDKKFCDDYCRNVYNNQLKLEENSYVRNITTALKKNRRILAELLGSEKMIKQTKNKLLTMGFNPHYHTHVYKNQKGNTYFFCYDYGYLPLEQDWYLIVKRKEEKPLSQ